MTTVSLLNYKIFCFSIFSNFLLWKISRISEKSLLFLFSFFYSNPSKITVIYIFTISKTYFINFRLISDNDTVKHQIPHITTQEIPDTISQPNSPPATTSAPLTSTTMSTTTSRGLHHRTTEANGDKSHNYSSDMWLVYVLAVFSQFIAQMAVIMGFRR